VYIGWVYGGITVGLAARLIMGLVIGSMDGIMGIVDCAGALQAVLVVLVVWFKTFLALKYLAYTLI